MSTATATTTSLDSAPTSPGLMPSGCYDTAGAELLPLLAAALAIASPDPPGSDPVEPMRPRRLRLARREAFMDLVRAVPAHALNEAAGLPRHHPHNHHHNHHPHRSESHPLPAAAVAWSPLLTHQAGLAASDGLMTLIPALVERGDKLMAAHRWQLALAPLTLALSGLAALPIAAEGASGQLVELRRLVAQCYGRAAMPKDALVQQQRVLQLVTASGSPDTLWAVLWDLSTAYADPALAAAISGDTNWSLHQAILYLKQAVDVPLRSSLQLSEAHMRLAALCDVANESRDVVLNHAQLALQLSPSGDVPTTHRHAVLDSLRAHLTKAMPLKAGPERTELLRRTAGVCLELAAAADLCPPDIAAGHRGRAYLHLAALYDLPGVPWEPNAREKALEYYTKGCAFLAEDVSEESIVLVGSTQRRIAVLSKKNSALAQSASRALPTSLTPASGTADKPCLIS